jgi:hypothetical protein
LTDAPATEEKTTPTKKQKLVLCPYCGHTQQADNGRCEDCGGLFEPLSRRATQISMGPWYIRDKKNPFRPGCSFKMLTRMIETGRVTATTVVRGPSTRQFWSIVRNVPGLSHRVGYCHKCGQHVQPSDESCPACEAPFKKIRQRNELGLQFPTQREADAAQRALDRHLGIEPPAEEQAPTTSADSAALDAIVSPDDSGITAAGGTPKATGDLLNDLFGDEAAGPPPSPDAVKPLDFSPSDDAASAADSDAAGPSESRPAASPVTEPQRPVSALTPASTGSSKNWLIWVMVALNLLIVAGLVYYLTTQS